MQLDKYVTRALFVWLLVFLCSGLYGVWAGCVSASMGYGAEVLFFGPNVGCGGEPCYHAECSPKIESGGKVYVYGFTSDDPMCHSGITGVPGGHCDNGYAYASKTLGSCVYTSKCDNQCSADSLICSRKGDSFTWNSDSCTCDSIPPCDAQCECENGGGIWHTTNGGFCEPNCETKYCCDSLNQNLPPETETVFIGCVAADPTNDRCVMYDSAMTSTDTTALAECNGLSEYEVCTKTYTWGSGKNSDGKQCSASITQNCQRFTQRDSMCTSVICTAYQKHALSSLDYDKATGCYSGTETVDNMLSCSNGTVQHRNSYTRPWKVCDSYLDSLNTNISDYLAGATGSGPGTGIGTGNGTSTNGMPSGWDGGTSTDNQGNEVTNSASPGLGGYTTPTPSVVTQYDSTTGTTEIVKNSAGGDSVVVTNQFNELRCLGVSGGTATLTNGTSTWTCSGVMSCGQALISARINGGACSAGANGVVTYGDEDPSMPTINGDSLMTGFEFEDLERGLDAITVTLNAIANKDTLHREKVHLLDRNQQDSLWKATFGEGLDAVRNMQSYIESASSANSAAIASAASTISSANSAALSAVASNISTSIGNASSNIAGATNRVRDTLHHTNELLERGISANSSSIGSATSQITGAIGDVNNSISVFKQAYVDSVNTSNRQLRSIFNSLDTGGIIPRNISATTQAVNDLPHAFDSVYTLSLDSWFNDRLAPKMDSNAVMVARAIDSLEVEVTLDSIKIDMPRDSLIDTINANLKSLTSQFERGAVFDPRLTYDTTDFAALFESGYQEGLGDTSIAYDSSLGEYIKSVNWVNGSSFTDSGFVDSVASGLTGRIDSSMRAMNTRSDSATNAYKDTLMKYSGIDETSSAINELFDGTTTSCSCLDIEVTTPDLTGKQIKTEIKFSKYLCELTLFNNMSAIDFIKLVLKLFTSIFCVVMIINAVGKRAEDKK